MGELEKLGQNREALLKAEIAAWLHDMGKCRESFFKPGGMSFKTRGCRKDDYVNPYKAMYSPQELKKLPYWLKLSEDDRCLRLQEASHPTSLCMTSMDLGSATAFDFKIELFKQSSNPPLTGRDLILWGRPFMCKHFARFETAFGKNQAKIMLAYLGRSHAAAHIEKEEPPQRSQTPFISTPFGWDRERIGNLDEKMHYILRALKRLGASISFNANPKEVPVKREALRKELELRFSRALADNRYPDNEVTLWDWSLIVSALYKAALAGALLSYKPEPNELRWRLLSIRFDGLGFLSQAHRIPDLLGRKRALEDALDRVKELLEVEYPLGTEVYRDENGSIFVVPGCGKGNCTLDLLNLNGNGKSLQELIREKVQDALKEEIIPVLHLDEEPWWGQDPGRDPAKDEPPSVTEHIKPVITKPNVNEIAKLWGKAAEVCTVCGLRPQGPSQKARSRHVCGICMERREDRAKSWAQQDLQMTVWINEVADINGRVALIVGRFDLSHWLDGTLIKTLAVADPKEIEGGKKRGKKILYETKTPSFVRLYRIWRTTRLFWQEILSVPGETNGLEEKPLALRLINASGPRLAIRGEPGDGLQSSLSPYHAYELVLLPQGVKLSAVWDGDNQRFITCDNLEYLCKQRLGRPVKEILAPGLRVCVEEPVGYGAENKELGDFIVRETSEATMYIPAIPIMAEPQTFMALVPADCAIEIVKEIKRKYEREMGKVRNRLPLHLGLVFAHRRTPLRAILDAGRRLLQQHFPAEGWTVVCASRRLLDRGDPLPQRFRGDGENHFQEWFEVLLQREDREFTWYAPARMGDGQTPDVWYPYVFLNQTIKPTGRRRTFKAQNPWTGEEHWLVHVEDLKPGDEVFFTPATLDWVWLDTNARRFEIAYNEQGQRRSPHLKRRPYLLDELEVLERIWETLEVHLSRNQIHILRETIEAKRAQWGYPSPYDETFQKFCHDLLAEAEWRKGSLEATVPENRRGKLPWEVEGLEKSKWLERWANYAARGWLADAVELYWEILKGGREEEPVREVERT